MSHDADRARRRRRRWCAARWRFSSASGIPVFQGRAWMWLANAYVGLEQPAETNEACTRALALARQCGDLSCQGATLNLLAGSRPTRPRLSRCASRRSPPTSRREPARAWRSSSATSGRWRSAWVSTGKPAASSPRPTRCIAGWATRARSPSTPATCSRPSCGWATWRRRALRAPRPREIVRALQIATVCRLAVGVSRAPRARRGALCRGRPPVRARVRRAGAPQRRRVDGVGGRPRTRAGQGGRAREGAGGHPPRGRTARGEGPRLAGRHGSAGPLVAACAGARGESPACRGGQRTDQGLRIPRRPQCATG